MDDLKRNSYFDWYGDSIFHIISSLCNLKFVDKYGIEKFERDIEDKNKYAAIERETFEELIEDIAEVRCKNCNRDYKTCKLYNVLDESLRLEEGEKDNCKYSCDL